MTTLAYLAGGVVLLGLILTAARMVAHWLEWHAENIEEDWHE